jgi:DNA-binding LacI/PurR family transcriptional regulator
VTIAAVAEIAGVSKATVSRVINQQSNVHPDTVRAVRRAMERAQYAPQPRGAGRRLGSGLESRQGSPKVLSAFALVVPEVSRGLYWSLQQGFATQANEMHHQILVCNTKNDVYRQADEILQLACKKIAGVALVSVTAVPTPPAHVELLQNAGIPVVVLHRAIEGAHAPLIRLPLEQIGYRAGRAALERGHRRIAFFTMMGEDRSSRMHEAGLRRAMDEAGAPLDESLVVHCAVPSGSTSADVEAAVAPRLAQLWALPADRRPTVIYATFDTLAEVIYLCLMRMGLSIPDDVSLISFGDACRDGTITKRITSVVVDESHAGQLAVDLVAQMRRGTRLIQDEEQFSMPVSLSDGETLGQLVRQES